MVVLELMLNARSTFLININLVNTAYGGFM
jgi:hypothetical protein